MRSLDPGRPGRLRQRDPPAPRHRRLLDRVRPGVGARIARDDVHQHERIEHHRQPVGLHPRDRLHDRGIGRRAAEDRPPVDRAHHLRRRPLDPGHHPAHRVAVLVALLDRRFQPARTAAEVVAEPGDHQRHRAHRRQLGRQLVERGGEIGDPAIVVHVQHRGIAPAAPQVDRLGRQHVLAGPGHQRHPADVQRRRARQSRQRLGGSAEDLEVELRDPVAERRQVQRLDHDVGRAAIGRRHALDRLDQRIGQLLLGSRVQPEGHGRLVERLPVRPDAPDPRDLALAERDREADRIAVFTHGRAAAALAADALGVHRLEEPARPDQLSRDAVAPERARQGRTFARAHHPEPLDPSGLHRRGARAQEPLVERRADHRAGRLADRHRAKSGDRAADRPAEGRARGCEKDRRHQLHLSGKRNAPAIRRAQAGVSGDSSTPCPE